MSDLLGWYLQKSSDDYHNGPGLSASDMKLLLQSPAHYKAPRKEETPAMIQGEAFHTYTLQNDLFYKQYYVLSPNFDGRSKEGKALKAELIAEGQTPLKREEFVQIRGMADAIHAHPLIAEILKEGQAEVSGYAIAPNYPDLLVKCRIDWLATRDNILLDLKSTTIATLEAFSRIAYDKKYHVQAAVYLYVTSLITKVEHRTFLFAAVEREPPHGVVLYQADPEFIQEGEKLVQQALAIYKQCMETGEWPCYSQEIHSLGLPGWKKKKDIYE